MQELDELLYCMIFRKTSDAKDRKIRSMHHD